MAGNVFGSPKQISGQSVGGYSTLVPFEVLGRLKFPPISATYTSTTFVLNGTTTNPICFPIGNDFFRLEETKTYTWQAGALNTILSSAGVVTTLQSPATGGWYFYVAIDTDGSYLMYPSQTEPEDVTLNHPGTSKTLTWRYVGYQICSATTTPAFVACTKIGYQMHMPDGTLTVATTSAWAERAFTAGKALPKHGALGVTVSGHINAGAATTVSVGSTSSSTTGIYKVGDPTATGDQFAPLPPIAPNANGKLWSVDSGARGDTTVTIITDIV